jgi:hypothetical protein
VRRRWPNAASASEYSLPAILEPIQVGFSRACQLCLPPQGDKQKECYDEARCWDHTHSAARRIGLAPPMSPARRTRPKDQIGRAGVVGVNGALPQVSCRRVSRLRLAPRSALDRQRAMFALVGSIAAIADILEMRLSIRFDTGAENYRWLNQSLLVAAGRLLGTGSIEYAVYRWREAQACRRPCSRWPSRREWIDLVPPGAGLRLCPDQPFTSSNSTSNISVAFGGMRPPPAPRAP